MDSNSWKTRSSNGKLSLSTSNSTVGKDTTRTDSPRTLTSSRRLGGDTPSSARPNPFNNITSASGGALASPSTGGASAFGFGSGAFAKFASSKVPKTPGAEANEQEKGLRNAEAVSTDNASGTPATSHKESSALRYTWSLYFRPPTAKNEDYELSIKKKATISTAEQFCAVYKVLTRPSALPIVSEYHFFKEGIRPVWEDEENKRGGKFILRLKKRVIDRYWEDLLMALAGDCFGDAIEEVTGIVVSVRHGEDVLSIWTKFDGGKNNRIRETTEAIKRVLNAPADTVINFKSHNASIAQRSALDESRRDTAARSGPYPKRRETFSEDSGDVSRKHE